MFYLVMNPNLVHFQFPSFHMSFKQIAIIYSIIVSKLTHLRRYRSRRRIVGLLFLDLEVY